MAEGEILYIRKDRAEGPIGVRSDDDGGSTSVDDDTWDDKALVDAYDRAVSLAKEEVARRMGLSKDSVSGNESTASKKPRRKKRKNKKEWHVGDECRARYSVDGVTYEGTIDAVFPQKGTCLVMYAGYRNVEEVPLKLLQPSQGAATRRAQELTAEEELIENGLEMDLSDENSVKGAADVRPRPGSAQATRMDWEPRPLGSRFMRPLRMPSMDVPPMLVPPPPPPHLTNCFPEEDSEALSSMLMSWYMSGFHTGYYQGLKQAKHFASSGGEFSRNSSRKK